MLLDETLAAMVERRLRALARMPHLLTAPEPQPHRCLQQGGQGFSIRGALLQPRPELSQLMGWRGVRELAVPLGGGGTSTW